MNKKQQQQLDRYIKHLNITTEGEKYILEHILKRDWYRDIIVISIDTIKYNLPYCKNLVWVECRTRNGCYSFSVGHIGADDCDTDDIQKQKKYVSRDLYHKISK